MKYQFQGEWHHIGIDEVQAIEASGPPHRVQDYANPNAVNVWPGSPSWKDTASSMESRPGITEPEAHPIIGEGRSYKPKDIGKQIPIHYAYGTGKDRMSYCGAAPGHGAYGRESFAKFVDHERACERCVTGYYRHIAEGRGKYNRTKDGYVVPVNYTEEERRLVGIVTGGVKTAPSRAIKTRTNDWRHMG
jgi:hypothetical protein